MGHLAPTRGFPPPRRMATLLLSLLLLPMRLRLVLPLLFGPLLLGCPSGDAAPPADYVVTARYPHDATAYTQGLVWADSVLYESTGRYVHSDVRRVELRTGRVVAAQRLASDRFGEGLALLDGTLYQLTWESGIAYTYDAATLAPRDSFPFEGQGWGLATDGAALWMSDGSDSLRVLDPRTFRTQKVVHVTFNGAPLKKINEMEWVDGMLLANVYETDRIVRIDPATGVVQRTYDLSELYPDRAPTADVLNGIALAPRPGELLVTGKYWPTIYQLRLK